MRIQDANGVARACRAMTADRLQDIVAERAPDGFTDIGDVLPAEEPASLRDGWRRTTDTDVAALNSRPSWDPPRRR